MFPKLEFKVYGLKPEATYEIYVDMVSLDVNNWKFNSGAWIPSGQAEQCQKTGKNFEGKMMEKISWNNLRLSLFTS
jgi:hypothetical protein